MLLPVSAMHRLRWSTLPIAARAPIHACLGFGPHRSHLPASRAVRDVRAVHGDHSPVSPPAPGWHSGASSRSALWLCAALAAGAVWFESSSASSDAAPPRAVNSKASLARQVNRAAAVGDVASLRRLLRDNPAPDTANLPHPSGWTPLLTAAANGHDEAVRLLLDHGADCNVRDKYVVTRRNLSNDLLRTRAEFQAEINPRISCVDWTPLHYGR